MTATALNIIMRVIGREGGYVNDPDDLGGETRYGISKRQYPQLEIKELTVEEAADIYYEDYWLPSRADELTAGLQEIYFDMTVHMGQRRAVKIIQRAVNGQGGHLIEDGLIGRQTITHSKRLESDRLRAYRVLYYTDLIRKRPEQEKFYYGWYKRTIEV